MDLKLDPQTGDLLFSNNTLYVTDEGEESIAQRLKIRLRFFYREWVLDRSQGTKWFERVIRKGVTLYVADQEVRRVVLATSGVKSIESWRSTIDTSIRKYDVVFSVLTTQGQTLEFGFKDILNN